MLDTPEWHEHVRGLKKTNNAFNIIKKTHIQVYDQSSEPCYDKFPKRLKVFFSSIFWGLKQTIYRGLKVKHTPIFHIK